jgi:3-isopropylmalate/(R)-2-methylmalate dehydratase small subunit
MEKFTKIEGIAAPLGMLNVDTDMIIPKQYLKTIQRRGLGKALFSELRYNDQGEENEDFVLNQGPFRDSEILVTGRNFGCGSSREHAPWALLDFGIRVVIAPSFADIFYSNMFKNGMLPILLSEERINRLIQFLTELPGAKIAVDLEKNLVKGPDGIEDAFSIPAHQRNCLLEGLDEIELTLAREDKVLAFEIRTAAERPWI